MAWYRIYFLGDEHDIRNVDEFDAADDAAAVAFADTLHEAVSDLYSGYEVWHLKRRIAKRDDRAQPLPCCAPITAAMQESLLLREEILLDSETAFARSRNLLARMAELRHALGRPEPAKSRKPRAASRA